MWFVATVLDSADLKDAEVVSSVIFPLNLLQKTVSDVSSKLAPICMFPIAAVTSYPKLSA